ncbi:hypothetical protein PSTT_01368 [Puccinia striiformis]|uniref:Prolyl endopeptidase n=1 Tax=Puccinia striiformis TaxID=27350 RepID=A0A2S4W409_9BASI|nr:hypothetical protein PSTT_01368 [Puccinia striiformis]
MAHLKALSLALALLSIPRHLYCTPVTFAVGEQEESEARSAIAGLLHDTHHDHQEIHEIAPSSSPTSSGADQLNPTDNWRSQPAPYPNARRDPNLSDVFQSKENGEVNVPDPYGWLHEHPKNSEEVQKFITSQQDLTKDYINKYPYKDQLHAAVTKIWDYPDFQNPSLEKDGYYYFYFNSGLQAQDILYRTKKGEENEAWDTLSAKEPGGELFLDPHLLSADGTAMISFYAFSESATYFSYGVSHSGSDSNTIYVRRTDSPHPQTAEDGGKKGEDPGRMSDVVQHVKFGTSRWLKDSGFFYTRFPAKSKVGESGGSQREVEEEAGTDSNANHNHMLYFHKLGDPQSKDTLILEDPENPTHMWGASVINNAKYLLVSTYKGSNHFNRVWIADLTSQPLSSEMNWHKIVNDFDGKYSLVTTDDSLLYFETNKDATNQKVVTFDLKNPEKGFQDLIPEDPLAFLADAHPINKDLAVLTYSRDVKDQLYLHDLKSGKRIKQIAENLVGTVSSIRGTRQSNELLFQMNSFESPPTTYRYSFDRPEGQELSVFRKMPVNGIDSGDLVSKQVFYESKDGTRVPMFIIHHKDYKQDGTAPGLQYGYGGFASSMEPHFSITYATFITRYGGVVAVPNIRGGEEYGKDWHLNGSLAKKQNVFDDFQYATKYLVAHKYVAEDKVTIMGGSNGGLLVAACVNQAPGLYGAAVSEFGVLDMLRFHKFTIGHAWITEFGNPEDPEAFDYLMKYSPLHNINPNAKYPAFMLETADHNDRVVPMHSFKHLAALQHALPDNPQPFLLRLEHNAGHGSGRTVEQLIQSIVDELSFVALSLGLKWKPQESPKPVING